MHMDDLWCSVVIRGEPDVERELIARLELSDGTEPGRNGKKAEAQPPAPKGPGALAPPPSVDLPCA
jgi:hypothetical protein